MVELYDKMQDIDFSARFPTWYVRQASQSFTRLIIQEAFPIHICSILPDGIWAVGGARVVAQSFGKSKCKYFPVLVEKKKEKFWALAKEIWILLVQKYELKRDRMEKEKPKTNLVFQLVGGVGWIACSKVKYRDPCMSGFNQIWCAFSRANWQSRSFHPCDVSINFGVVMNV